MPKRGQRQPYQVRYTYPPSERAPQGVSGTIACYSLDEAGSKARDLQERGAHGTIVHRETKRVAATFGKAPA